MTHISISSRNVAELLATTRKTIRFAEDKLGIVAYEFDLPETSYESGRDRITVLHSEIGIVDPECHEMPKPPYNYSLPLTFHQTWGGKPYNTDIGYLGFMQDIEMCVYNNGGHYHVQQTGFMSQYLQISPDSQVQAKTVTNAEGKEIYIRQRAEGPHRKGWDERYAGIEGVHMRIGRGILMHVMMERGETDFDKVAAFCDSAMDILKPQDYAATYADFANRQKLRPHVPPRRKFLGLF